ncbi:hypothetical protein BO86DRAFT_52647 [Aspergillus japonicus CBS 114.51]|uniref:Transcription factor domain-containing protein n=1 Tax=Aspergillus japonicus CBS 114.51 TaxID=1448312 RepID=A0A8T8WJ88_ASPJA|nr:hypothetical protein BO86DRAFT_52647 [Aspergillus japonicus CBS 114.51]RAH75787.1 hypothetical protein BO86DRAFT_52647 [Aspergillus japonicus CBS 114.51]
MGQAWRSHIAGGNSLSKLASKDLWWSSRSAWMVFQTFQEINLMAMLTETLTRTLLSLGSLPPSRSSLDLFSSFTPAPRTWSASSSSFPTTSTTTTPTTTIYSSTAINSNHFTDSEPTDLLEVLYKHVDPSYTQEALGISAGLMKIIAEILCFQDTYLSATNIGWAKLQLSLFIPGDSHCHLSTDLFSPSSRSSSAFISGPSHHQYVFSYSTLICYKQSVPPYTRTVETDTLAILGLLHILALDFNYNHINDHYHTPFIWAIVIISSKIQRGEMKSRDQILAWLSRRQQTGFTIYALAEEVVREIWRMRDSGDNRACRALWREFIEARLALDVFLGVSRPVHHLLR